MQEDIVLGRLSPGARLVEEELTGRLNTKRHVLRQAFEMLTATGPLAGATLVLEPFDVRLSCACGYAGSLGHDDMVGGSMAVCPACGELTQLPPTAELELVQVAFAD